MRVLYWISYPFTLALILLYLIGLSIWEISYYLRMRLWAFITKGSSLYK